MLKYLLTFLIVSIFNNCIAQTLTDGSFVGYEKLCWERSNRDSCINTIGNKKSEKWYRENILRLKGDSVFLSQSPVIISIKDTLYSASDGGFYYYTGAISKDDSGFTFSLIEESCDYCPQIRQKQDDGTVKIVRRTRVLFGRLVPNGILIDDILYKPLADNIEQGSE